MSRPRPHTVIKAKMIDPETCLTHCTKQTEFTLSGRCNLPNSILEAIQREAQDMAEISGCATNINKLKVNIIDNDCKKKDDIAKQTMRPTMTIPINMVESARSHKEQLKMEDVLDQNQANIEPTQPPSLMMEVEEEEGEYPQVSEICEAVVIRPMWQCNTKVEQHQVIPAQNRILLAGTSLEIDPIVADTDTKTVKNYGSVIDHNPFQIREIDQGQTENSFLLATSTTSTENLVNGFDIDNGAENKSLSDKEFELRTNEWVEPLSVVTSEEKNSGERKASMQKKYDDDYVSFPSESKVTNKVAEHDVTKSKAKSNEGSVGVGGRQDGPLKGADISEDNKNNLDKHFLKERGRNFAIHSLKDVEHIQQQKMIGYCDPVVKWKRGRPRKSDGTGFNKKKDVKSKSGSNGSSDDFNKIDPSHEKRGITHDKPKQLEITISHTTGETNNQDKLNDSLIKCNDTTHDLIHTYSKEVVSKPEPIFPVRCCMSKDEYVENVQNQIGSLNNPSVSRNRSKSENIIPIDKIESNNDSVQGYHCRGTGDPLQNVEPAVKRKRGRPRKPSVSSVRKVNLQNLAKEQVNFSGVNGSFATEIGLQTFKNYPIKKIQEEHRSLTSPKGVVVSNGSELKIVGIDDLTLARHTQTKVLTCNLCEQNFITRKDYCDHKLNCFLKCLSCSKTFCQRYELRRHLMQKGGCGKVKRERFEKEGASTLFECFFCQEVFRTANGLSKHESQHSGRKNFLCEVCETQFKSFKGYSQHKRGCFGKMQCELCGKKFQKKSLLKRHEERGSCTTRPRRNKNEDQKAFPCTICDKVFEFKCRLDMHMDTHNRTNNYPCEFCPRTFKVKASLTNHLRISHTDPDNAKSVCCSLCPNKYLNRDGLKYHMKSHVEVHLKEGWQTSLEDGADATRVRYSCFLCHDIFSKVFNWFSHLVHCHNKENDTMKETLISKYKEEFDSIAYPCSFCHKVFFKKSVLQHHLIQKHGILKGVKTTSYQKYCCEHCGDIFKSENALSVHMKSHNKITKEISFMCDICGEGFKEKLAFVRHCFKSHGTELESGKISKCKLCGHVFLSKTSLKHHVQVVHEKIKAFICSTCNKAFGTKYALQVHSRLHTKEKPYVCQICPKKAFSDPSNLIAHCRKRHPEWEGKALDRINSAPEKKCSEPKFETTLETTKLLPNIGHKLLKITLPKDEFKSRENNNGRHTGKQVRTTPTFMLLHDMKTEGDIQNDTGIARQSPRTKEDSQPRKYMLLVNSNEQLETEGEWQVVHEGLVLQGDSVVTNQVEEYESLLVEGSQRKKDQANTEVQVKVEEEHDFSFEKSISKGKVVSEEQLFHQNQRVNHQLVNKEQHIRKAQLIHEDQIVNNQRVLNTELVSDEHLTTDEQLIIEQLDVNEQVVISDQLKMVTCEPLQLGNNIATDEYLESDGHITSHVNVSDKQNMLDDDHFAQVQNRLHEQYQYIVVDKKAKDSDVIGENLSECQEENLRAGQNAVLVYDQDLIKII